MPAERVTPPAERCTHLAEHYMALAAHVKLAAEHVKGSAERVTLRAERVRRAVERVIDADERLKPAAAHTTCARAAFGVTIPRPRFPLTSCRGFPVQPSRHNSQATSVRAARVVAALVLVLALLSGIAPTGSLASVPASACSMSCCVGLPAHAAGECASVSCHVKLPEQNAAPHDTHGQAHDAHGESHEVEIAASAHQDESQPQTATTAHKDGHAAHAKETHGAETLQATESSATTNTGHTASSKSKREDRRPSVAPASLARPCTPGCGMAAGNAGNNVRPRDAATLTAAERSRPPAPVALSKHSSGLTLASAGKHRLAPSRAPPLDAL